MRPEVRLPQLCAIAKAAIVADPRISDAEWKARIKCELVALGFSYPAPHAISQAMSQVEAALTKRWGQRPV